MILAKNFIQKFLERTFSMMSTAWVVSLASVEDVVTEEVVTEVADEGSGTLTDECHKAIDELENESNELVKVRLKTTCESACKEETAKCGYLANVMSMILFALLAALKYVFIARFLAGV